METKVITKTGKLLNAKFLFHAGWGFMMFIKAVDEETVSVQWFGGSIRKLPRTMVERDCHILTTDAELIQCIVTTNYKRELDFGKAFSDKECYDIMDYIYKEMEVDYRVNYLEIYQVIRKLFKNK